MSDQDNNIFSGSPQDPAPTEPTSGGEVNHVQDPAPVPYATALSGITNEEGKQKYESVEQALASISPANEHIQRVESENAQMREEMSKARTAEDILNEIKSTAVTSPIEPTSAAIDISQIETLVDTRLTVLEEAKIAKRNEQIVVETLTKHFGSSDKANEEYSKKAKELGLSIDWMNSIAAKSPNALLKQFDISPTSSPVPTKTTGGAVTVDSTTEIPPLSEASIMRAPKKGALVAEWRNAGKQAEVLAAQG